MMADSGQSTFTLIDRETLETWPTDLRAYLDQHYELFLDWETGSTKVTAAQYDRAVYALEAVLRQYALVGWHCTRLTEDEIESIMAGGMQLPNAAMLNRRLKAVTAAGLLSRDLADRLKAKHQAGESGRADRVWFCFFPPRLAGESGISCFFRYWGGEALYNSHAENPETGAAIGAIGSPCIIEAVVPIASLREHSFLHQKITRRYLISRGLETVEPVDHEDWTGRPLPAANIRRFIRFPSPEFVALTGCDGWRESIG